MKVELIGYTPNPEELAYIAAKTCYSKKPPLELFKSKLNEKEKQLIRKIIKSGHTSVIEHINFTFLIEGISRSCSHQLVRHRIASYSQQSQRYVKYGDMNFVVPPSIMKNNEANKIYIDFMKNVEDIYLKLIELGINKEDSRFVLPNAAKTNIILTMNARSLWNFFNLRCCIKSQWEIRKLAWKILELVKKVSPILFEKAGPWCYDGECPEDDEDCRIRMLKKHF
jgi:thymidylate synthase (FAD)